MATLDELQAAVDRIGKDVTELIAAQVPVDFQPQIDALNASAASAEAALPAAPVAEPPAEPV